MMSKRKIVLKSCDGEYVEVDEAIALKSKKIADTIEEHGSGIVIHIVNVESKILKYVFSCCETRVIKIEQSNLIPVIQAVKHLKIEEMLEGFRYLIPKMIKDKSAEEIRAMFNIEKPLTEEQEEEIRNNFLNSIVFDQALTPTMSEKTITLKSSDGESFVVHIPVALKMKTIANTIEDIGYTAYVDGIPINNVKSNILKLVIYYCMTHIDPDDSLTEEKKEQIKEMDNEFILKMDKEDTLRDVLMAANYLNVKNLIDLCAQAIADRIKGKTAEEVRTYLGIENDFTKEEEEKIRRENHFAFDDSQRFL